MEKALRTAVSYTFGSAANSKSNGKSKNSKSNKGNSKATREFIEKEIISTQTANEIKEMNQLTSFCDSDGQSYGTSEEENEIECSQQQSGQEITMVGEPLYVSQECGQACLAVQEEDALSGDEFCQKQYGQQEESLVQQSTKVDVAISNIGEACYATPIVQSTKPIEVSQQSTITAAEENEAGVICAESQIDCQSVQEVVEKSKIIEEAKATKKTSIVSQESQKVSQTIDHIVEACDDNKDAKIVKNVKAVTKTADVSEQSQKKSQSIGAAVAPCYAAEVISTPVEVIKKSITTTKSQKNVNIVDAGVKQVDSSKWCGVEDVSEIKIKKVDIVDAGVKQVDSSKWCGVEDVSEIEIKKDIVDAGVKQVDSSKWCGVKDVSEIEIKKDTVDTAVRQVDSSKWCGVQDVSEIETQKEITQSSITKTTENHEDSCKKAAVVEKCYKNIETEIKHALNVEMSLEAKSKFSATIEEDSEVLITAKFVNPLSTPLTGGKFWIEADNLGKPYCFEIPHIDAGETVICRALIFPRCAGYEFIVARFVSHEIKRIIGFTNIRVSRAVSCESTSEIIVSKIVNQKVVATKKM